MRDSISEYRLRRASDHLVSLFPEAAANNVFSAKREPHHRQRFHRDSYTTRDCSTSVLVTPRMTPANRSGLGLEARIPAPPNHCDLNPGSASFIKSIVRIVLPDVPQHNGRMRKVF